MFPLECVSVCICSECLCVWDHILIPSSTILLDVSGVSGDVMYLVDIMVIELMAILSFGEYI